MIQTETSVFLTKSERVALTTAAQLLEQVSLLIDPDSSECGYAEDACLQINRLINGPDLMQRGPEMPINPALAQPTKE